MNECKLDINILDSTWFQNTIRNQGFKVSSHLRWQRFGKGRALKKLVLIKEYEKNGYIRNARKLNY